MPNLPQIAAFIDSSPASDYLPWITFAVAQIATITGVTFKFGVLSERMKNLSAQNDQNKNEIQTLRDAFNYSKGREDALREVRDTGAHR